MGQSPKTNMNCVSGRPFVKRFALCYRNVVLSCLSVCNVGLLWPNGWMDQDETWHGDRPRSRPHCVRWEPSPARSFRLMFIVAKGRPSQLLLSSCTFGPRRNVSHRKDRIPLRYPGRRPVARWNLGNHALSTAS